MALFLATQRVDRGGLHARVAQRGEYYARCDWSLPKVSLTNRFYPPMRLFSNRSNMTSKCGKNKVVAHEPQASVSLMFLPHFDVLCDLLLNRPTATWNLFVLYNDQKRKKTDTHTCLVPLDCSNPLYFVSASSFFSLSYLYTVSLKRFSMSFLAQIRIMAKLFCKTASLS